MRVKRFFAMVLMLMLFLAMLQVDALAACDHVDEYGYALYGTVLETWQEHQYENVLEHYTVEYERFICEGCGEEAVHFTDWYGYHMTDADGYCFECNCKEDGTPRPTVAFPWISRLLGLFAE